NAIVVYFINDRGELETVTSGRYDALTGTVVFTTGHFSQYAVGYNKINFADVKESDWYAKAVTYLSARQITSGTDRSLFSPDATLTRGQFITLLMRAYVIAPDANPTANFADAGNAYYTGYLAAAKRLGISSGVGDNKFAPRQAITRQEMFTLLYNTLNSIRRLPEGNSGKTLSDFTDGGSIPAYAQEAMAYLVKTGTVSASGGKLDPAATSTRAQLAQLLYNLLEK
ncbi:MAG: S-layer homology domain-containing protein, partial [Peptococcaceae bacterium]|nr:S-layer homology domain-containing protein [Peptococcaceae bacterium]